MKPEVHIAGLLVQTVPEECRKVAKTVSSLPQAEVRASGAAGKLVVVCECGSEDEVMVLVGRIRELPGVLSVALVYQHAESAAAVDEVVSDEADTSRVH